MKLCLWSWLGVARQQAITRANVDQVLYRHMSSLNHNGLIEPYPSVNPYIETGYKKMLPITSQTSWEIANHFT